MVAAKLDRNRQRDLLVTRTLRAQGWSVVRVWGCHVVEQLASMEADELLTKLPREFQRLQPAA